MAALPTPAPAAARQPPGASGAAGSHSEDVKAPGLPPGRLTRVLRTTWLPVRLIVRLSSVFLAWFFLTVPGLVRAWVPHSSEILSMGFLYIFAQALGLMWMLLVNMISIFSVGFVDYVQRSLSSEHSQRGSALEKVLAAYVQYCILRIMFFIGLSLGVIGWEAFSDFPTVRHLVIGERGSRGGGGKLRSTSACHERGGPARQRPPGAAAPRGATANDGFEVISETGEWTSEDDAAGKTFALGTPCRERSLDTQESPLFAPEDFARQESQDPSTEDVSQPDWQPGAPGSSASSGANAGRSRRRRRFFLRKATLLAPLLGMIACKVALVAVMVACDFGAMSCDSSEGLFSLTRSGGRLNCGMRFALNVALIQWFTEFIHLFPAWHRGLCASGAVGWAVELAGMLLIPASAWRVLLWLPLPRPVASGLTVPHATHYDAAAIDSGVLLCWQLWLLAVCLLALRQPETSGFSQRTKLVEHGAWGEMSTLFKYSFLVPAILRFVRGCLINGFAGAQTDLLVLVCAYPLLLTAVWTLVWAVVVAPGKRLLLLGMVGSVSLASTVCSMAGLPQVAPTVFVWLHLMRQYLKIFRNRRHHLEGDAASSAARQQLWGRHQTGSFDNGAPAVPGEPRSPPSTAGAPSTADGRRTAPQRYRVCAKLTMVVAAFIALSLSGVLISLSVVSSIQQRIDWFPSTIWFNREEQPPALVVDHLVSRMRLEIGQGPNASSRPSGATRGVSYAACGHLWHGLSVLDYSLLSLASYFDISDPSLQPLLESMFPPEYGLRGRLRPHGPSERPAVGRAESRLRWLEVEMQAPGLEKPVLVIAVRGTDPIRASDYVEDIRMWTEPVCISILSTIFPTVRAWPRQTAETVIKGIHDMLDSLGLPDDKWSYTELVHHVRQIPREPYSQVVLTGHSLGGGTATVVAALTQLPVVGITPPGIYWSLAKHNYFFGRNGTDAPLGARRDAGISNWMHHQSLTLVVENDWVNGIFDDHGGLVQMMTCDRSEESLQLACHMLEGTICHLLSSCGDVHGRFTACSHEFLTDLNDQAQTTAVRMLLEVLGEVLPEHQRPRLAAFAAWIERPQLPDLGIPKGKVLLLLGFLVLLLAIGGATEELLLL